MAAATSSATLLIANDDKNPHRRCFFSPQRKINRKILTEGVFFSPVLCSCRLTNTVGEVCRLCKSRFIIACFSKLVIWRFVDLVLLQENSPSSLKSRWNMKIEMSNLLETVHEGHSVPEEVIRANFLPDLKRKESKKVKFSPKSHQRSHPVSVHPVKTNIKQIRPTRDRIHYSGLFLFPILFFVHPM